MLLHLKRNASAADELPQKCAVGLGVLHAYAGWDLAGSLLMQSDGTAVQRTGCGLSPLKLQLLGSVDQCIDI